MVRLFQRATVLIGTGPHFALNSTIHLRLPPTLLHDEWPGNLITR